jgi:hypothetical protein
MDRGVAIVVATAIGGTLALQAPLNSLLGRSVGGLQATIVAFTVGLAALLSVSVLAGGLADRMGIAAGYAFSADCVSHYGRRGADGIGRMRRAAPSTVLQWPSPTIRPAQ